MIIIDYNEDSVPVKINGKPVMKSYQNAYRKASNTDYFTKFENREGLIVRGNFLTPLESSIYKWIMDWQVRYEYALNNNIFPITEVTKAPVTAFDDMRYFFRLISPDVYMEILDQTTYILAVFHKNRGVSRVENRSTGESRTEPQE